LICSDWSSNALVKYQNVVHFSFRVLTCFLKPKYEPTEHNGAERSSHRHNNPNKLKNGIAPELPDPIRKKFMKITKAKTDLEWIQHMS